MYKSEREAEICRILMQQEYITVKQLSQELFISESSIRRDLMVLEQNGIVKRSYGGVSLVKGEAHVPPFSVRVHDHIPAKKRIAEKAAALVQRGDVVFLDQSSSAFFVAQALIHHTGLTVITNNIEIASFLSQTDMEVLCSGGRISKSNRNCLLGEDSHRLFQETSANIAFFSARAVSREGCIMDCYRDEIWIRRSMLENAKKRIFLCNSEKIGAAANFLQCTLDEVDYLISECSPEKLHGLESWRDRLL